MNAVALTVAFLGLCVLIAWLADYARVAFIATGAFKWRAAFRLLLCSLFVAGLVYGHFLARLTQ